MDLLNPEAVGVIGAASVTAIMGLLTTVTVSVLRNRSLTKVVHSEVEKTAENAQLAVSNTASISNGFAGRMDRKLDGLAEGQRKLQEAFTEHLEWHLNKEAQK